MSELVGWCTAFLAMTLYDVAIPYFPFSRGEQMTDTWQNEVGNIKVNDRGMRVSQRDGQEELLLEGQASTQRQSRSPQPAVSPSSRVCATVVQSECKRLLLARCVREVYMLHGTDGIVILWTWRTQRRYRQADPCSTTFDYSFFLERGLSCGWGGDVDAEHKSIDVSGTTVVVGAQLMTAEHGVRECTCTRCTACAGNFDRKIHLFSEYVSTRCNVGDHDGRLEGWRLYSCCAAPPWLLGIR